MPVPSKNRNDQAAEPTAASTDEKAAMERALARETSADLYDCLARENVASRAKAASNRRGFRKTS